MTVICVFALDRSNSTAFYRIKGEGIDQVHSCSVSALKYNNTNNYADSDAAMPKHLALADSTLAAVSVGYILTDSEWNELKAVSSSFQPSGSEALP